ncbi:MAG: FAD-binding domain-containing protein, partial [Paracoccaceae bacterium]
MNVLIWFKRDLRVEDHPALALGAGLGRVLPVYVVEPEYWALPDTSARQWGFVAQCLEDLREDLRTRGLPLAVRVGDAVACLEKLCRLHGINRIVSHEEVGNLWTFARDQRVQAWAKAAGIEWVEVPQSGVMRRSAGRDGGFAAHGVAALPGLTPVPGVELGVIPTARALRLADDRCAHVQAGGRARGVLVLESFLAARGIGYREAMISPVRGERASSRLSAYLAYGALSGREVAQATVARQAEKPGPAWAVSLRTFQSRLAWRDDFMQKLENEPQIEVRCLHLAAEGLRSRVADAARLVAWEKGETGLPFVDACMRYLAATGWLNFRMRAMVTSVASYHLWLDWRATGAVLARRFTDYEPVIHWPQMQMQAGET